MRTTIDLPDDLLRRAKIVAIERKTTLRELVETAIVHELHASPSTAAERTRVKFPIFESKSKKKLTLTNADIAKMVEEEDRRRHGRTR